MAELSIADLLSALQTTQAAQSTTRLSERNVVELVNKLKQVGCTGFKCGVCNKGRCCPMPPLQLDNSAHSLPCFSCVPPS